MKLTPNEQEALELAQRGLSQRTIALTLGISRSAVRARLENARRKLAHAKEAA
jgi:RNA polymerase sigma factor (sigma-70 family)